MSRLRELHACDPFRPYALLMRDGREFKVRRLDRVILHPDDVTVVLVEDSGETHLLDVRLAADLKPA